MKPHLSNLTAFLLILACVATTCKPECPDCPEPDPEPEVYPKEIAFTEYSLQGTSCQWKNLPYDEKVLIINSSEELEKHISCTEGSYPLIDFSKNSLLVASGETLTALYELNTKKIQKLSPDQYEMNIELGLYETSNMSKWNHALVIKKMNDNSYVDLNITLLPVLPGGPCNCIMDTLIGEWSWYKRVSWSGVDNEYKSIVRFFNQNEDGSINYEVFVEDTLFYRGSFRSYKVDWSIDMVYDIRLPHWISLTEEMWYFLFKDLLWAGVSSDELSFGIPSSSYDLYVYRKLK
jgi:hypothetical protein